MHQRSRAGAEQATRARTSQKHALSLLTTGVSRVAGDARKATLLCSLARGCARRSSAGPGMPCTATSSSPPGGCDGRHADPASEPTTLQPPGLIDGGRGLCRQAQTTNRRAPCTSPSCVGEVISRRVRFACLFVHRGPHVYGRCLLAAGVTTTHVVVELQSYRCGKRFPDFEGRRCFTESKTAAGDGHARPTG